MSSAVNAPPISIEQYLSFESPAGYYDELINGRIVVSPDPKPLHQDIAENIHTLLRAALGDSYKVGQRTNLRFADAHSMPSPDVFVITSEEWTRAKVANEYPAGSSALLLVEVVSPGNRSKKLKQKADLYKRHSLEVWMVYPARQEVKVWRPQSEIRCFSMEEHINVLGKSLAVADMFR